MTEKHNLKPDQPCGHPGCLHHATHPCEGCGRVAGHHHQSDDLPTGPVEYLEKLFTEADRVIEAHPELVEPMDGEQLERIEKLVEGVRADDLPTRLRELARNVEDISFEISTKDKMGDLMRTAQRLKRWADELEKEG